MRLLPRHYGRGCATLVAMDRCRRSAVARHTLHSSSVRSSDKEYSLSEPIAEHDVVVLTRDLPDEGLVAGDLGVVLFVHEGNDEVGPGFTIEVTTVLGDTIAVTDVPA